MEELSMIEVQEQITIQDRVNFCRETGFLLPNLPGFDNQFFLQVLKGEKLLFALELLSEYEFSYFTKEKKFTKKRFIKTYNN